MKEARNTCSSVDSLILQYCTTERGGIACATEYSDGQATTQHPVEHICTCLEIRNYMLSRKKGVLDASIHRVLVRRTSKAPPKTVWENCNIQSLLGVYCYSRSVLLCRQAH